MRKGCANHCRSASSRTALFLSAAAICLGVPSCGRQAGGPNKRVAIPPVSQCIVDSMTLVKGYGIFSHPVIVNASSLKDGSVRVGFRRAVSDVVKGNGRKDSQRILHVDFTTAGPKVSAPMQIWPKSDKAACRAAATACSYLSDRSQLPNEFEVVVKEGADAVTVSVISIPYRPGRHTTLTVSPEFKVAAVRPGK